MAGRPEVDGEVDRPGHRPRRSLCDHDTVYAPRPSPEAPPAHRIATGRGLAGARARLAATGELAAFAGDAMSGRFDTALAAAMTRFQTPHLLDALNVAVEQRIAPNRISLGCLRSVGHDLVRDDLLVDVAAYKTTHYLIGPYSFGFMPASRAMRRGAMLWAPGTDEVAQGGTPALAHHAPQVHRQATAQRHTGSGQLRHRLVPQGRATGTCPAKPHTGALEHLAHERLHLIVQAFEQATTAAPRQLVADFGRDGNVFPRRDHPVPDRTR